MNYYYDECNYSSAPMSNDGVDRNVRRRCGCIMTMNTMNTVGSSTCCFTFTTCAHGRRTLRSIYTGRCGAHCGRYTQADVVHIAGDGIGEWIPACAT